jgi:hypothetical protein
VLDYCLGVVEGAGPDQRRKRLAFWGTLALMRCVGSSPAAAASALRNRLAADPDRLEGQIFDEDSDEGDAVDVEPTSGLEQDEPLAALVAQAVSLAKAPDPKHERGLPFRPDQAARIGACYTVRNHVCRGRVVAMPSADHRRLSDCCR